jgi:hypothetical protein
MAYEENLEAISRPAGADLDAAGNQYKVVKLNASGAVINFAADTDIPVGVLQNAPKSGDPARIAYSGVSKVRVGAAVAAGAQLTTNGSGQAITAVSTKYIIGSALTAGAAAGSVISALIGTAVPVKA